MTDETVINKDRKKNFPDLKKYGKNSFKTVRTTKKIIKTNTVALMPIVGPKSNDFYVIREVEVDQNR